uniref:Uncharacterized protein n=1 Tax=Anguilla anguilla TaxID=7936 RepID=A0A0E9V708_ANGAN
MLLSTHIQYLSLNTQILYRYILILLYQENFKWQPQTACENLFGVNCFI